jgi:predicted DNA-binding WGR domain protein
MSIKLEYIHNTKDSKIWQIDRKGKIITIKFGKPDSNLNEKIITFKSDDYAKSEFDKRVSEKIKKGYTEMSKTQKSNKKTIDKTSRDKTPSVKKNSNKKQTEKHNDKKNIKSQLGSITVNTNNSFIDFLKEIGDVVGTVMDKLWQSREKKLSDVDAEAWYKNYENTISIFYNKKYKKIDKKIESFQNKNILPLLKSGVIVKHINNKVKENLLKSINLFSENKTADYHPGSDNKVLDIVHPSLYPLINENIKKGKNKVNKKVNKLDFWNRTYENSKYQWLPSEFKIDANGECKITSYINNLPISETDIYENIESLFKIVLPYFEDVWSFSNTFKLYTGEDWFLAPKKNIQFKKIELKNRTLQVITKIVKITLDNQELAGDWHIAGMSHENIVATASYTLQQDNNFNAELYFKRMYLLNEVQDIVGDMPENPPVELSNLLHNTLVPLGKVKINDGTLVVFPNSHIHKINMKSNDISHRTIIVFWLINPEIRIPSTKDIPQQDYSLQQAHKERLELMKERTYHKQTLNQRELNLFEH